ncbi:MAG: PAS domain S-box protein, partial [Rhodospirillales bacterium]|nr:PAS domain S-box protein [Rhodospirillales bacterium]
MLIDDIHKALSEAPGSILAAYPDGAVMVDADGKILSNNPQGAALATAVASGSDADLVALIKRAVAGKAGTAEAVPLAEDLQYEVTAIPIADGQAVLLLGRDQTFEHNMIAALIESRSRYKDFVETSSDFAWELDADGVINFVSPAGALDYTSGQIIGRRPEEFFTIPADEESPFAGTKQVENIQIQMVRADSDMAELLVSARPLFGKNGEWVGARGVCRDITEHRRDQAALVEARHREELLDRLVGIVGDEIEPVRALEAITAYFVEFSNFDGCAIYARDQISENGGGFRLVAGLGNAENAPEEEAILAAIPKVQSVMDLPGARVPALIVSTGYHQQVNGAFIVWHDRDVLGP